MEVSKKWLRIADTYGIDIGPGKNDVVLLAIAIALDETIHKAK